MAAKKKKPTRKPAPKSKRPSPRKAAPRKKALTSKRPKRPTKPKAPKKAPKRALPENPQALALAKAVAQVAVDKKAEDVVVLDVRARGSEVGYDYLVLASADTDRQLSAIADAVDEALRQPFRKPSSTERSPDWVLVNFDDVIVHLFTPDKRALYDLEGLWSDAPRLKVSRP
jgi:ribosome-associated protein